MLLLDLMLYKNIYIFYLGANAALLEVIKNSGEESIYN